MNSNSDIYALKFLIYKYIKLGVNSEKILQKQTSGPALNALSFLKPILHCRHVNQGSRLFVPGCFRYSMTRALIV